MSDSYQLLFKSEIEKIQHDIEKNKCEMSVEKCFTCPAARKIPAIYPLGEGKIIAPLTLVCEILDKELPVTECIYKQPRLLKHE